jgi:hypothetical protein
MPDGTVPVVQGAGTDQPSSFLYSDREAAADEDEAEIWDRFVAARAAIRALSSGVGEGVKDVC